MVRFLVTLTKQEPRPMKTLLSLLALLPFAANAGWEYQTNVDDFDGSTTHMLYVSAEVDSKPAVFALMCSEGGAPFFIYRVDDVITSDGEGTANMRLSVDGTPAHGLAASWLRSDQYHSASTYAAKAVLKQLSGGSRLIVRVTGVTESWDSVFDVSGIDDAVDQLSGHCRRL